MLQFLHVFSHGARSGELTLEGFNLFNRPNFFKASTTSPALYRWPNVTGLETITARGDSTKAPTQPLGFTSASNSRQLQFGARFNF